MNRLLWVNMKAKNKNKQTKNVTGPEARPQKLT